MSAKSTMIKMAEEFDAAGRVMARGFYDEFQKLAACGMKHGTGKGLKPKKKGKQGRGSKSGAIHMFMQD